MSIQRVFLKGCRADFDKTSKVVLALRITSVLFGCDALSYFEGSTVVNFLSKDQALRLIKCSDI